MLGAAVANVAAQYPDVPFTEKQAAWLGLLGATGYVYGPKVLDAISSRKAQKNQTRPQPAARPPATPAARPPAPPTAAKPAVAPEADILSMTEPAFLDAAE